MQKIMKNKGITLIALVISIIILLILTGVTIGTALGDNGLFKMAKKATESYQIASEKEYLEQNVLSVQLDKYLGNISSEKLGKELNTRNLSNTSNWHIIKVNDQSYETGWNYIEKGTELVGYGKAEHSWLVNYETGEVIQLEEDNYISLSAGDMLAVKDSLIINIDSSIIDKGVKTKTEIQQQLGKNVELVNFGETGSEESGLTSTSFNFDGIDDYIKVKYDSPEQKQQLADRGFTFEFYGIWNGGTTNGNLSDGYKGLFCYWNGAENKQPMFRFGVAENWNTIKWNAGLLKCYSDFSESKEFPWNIHYKINNMSTLRSGTYITVTLDTSKKYEINEGEYTKGTASDLNEKKSGYYYKQKVYMDGKKVYEGDYNKEGWDNFILKELLDLKYFCIGRSTMSEPELWHYSKMSAYCLRLYSRALTEDEVNKNYEKSVEYHSLLEK